MRYWIERWSQLRIRELMSYPQDFPIHDAYKTLCTNEELRSGFDELHEIFAHCYEDILNDPSGMLLSVYDMDTYGYFSREARSSRDESYKYLKIFYVLGYTGELQADGKLRIETANLKTHCKALKITNIGKYLTILQNYGILTEGLVNGKTKNDTAITVSFPDNKNVTAVLHLLAVKANRTNRFRDFCRLNYRLFESDWDIVTYGGGIEEVSDLFHAEQDRETARLMHEELLKRNYCYNFQDWNEGPQIRYYKKESDRSRSANADFWIASMDTELKLYFRIKNMDAVIEYIKSCPESVIRHFMDSDNGCANRISETCTSGISYDLNGKTVWRCGCCNPNFRVTPGVQDYMYYINIVDMAGSQKKLQKKDT